MTDDVKRIIARTIGHEGKFTSDPDDDGNWTGGVKGSGECKGTKFGISAKTYPQLDIENLTEEDAYVIYERDFYYAPHLDLLVDTRVRWKVFDIGVNSSPRRASMILQQAVGDPHVDGIIGKNTALIANLRAPSVVLDAIVALQIENYNAIVRREPAKHKYYEGWIHRAADKGEGL